MPRKPKHENPAPPAPTPAPVPTPVPNILDAFKNPQPTEPEAFQRDGAHVLVGTPRPLADDFAASGETATPTLPGDWINRLADDTVVAPLAEPAPTPTPPLPRVVEILFDIALEVSEKEKTNISTRLDAASELVAWLDSLGCARSSYDVPRTGALRVFLSSVAEYKVRCEPKERVRAAALLLKLG